MKKNKKKKEPNILLQKTTHPIAFFYSGIIFLLCIYYTLSNKGYGFAILFGMLVFLGIQYYFMFYGKKILLTEHKIYVYSKGKKHISWDLIKDFQYVNYNEDRLGKIFHCGTLNIMDKNKKVYSYFYLSDCKEVFDSIIELYEKKMVQIDPTYEPISKLKEEQAVDKLN